MSFLDSIGGLGGVVDKLGGSDKVMGMAKGLLDQAGGVDGLVQKFQGAGAGGKAESWVGTGDNQPVSPEEVTRALGDQEVEAVAQEAGVSKDEAAGGLAQLLPQLVDRLTPEGKVPDAGGLQGQLGKLLG
jgi:uncharacterized protein YidB (DUF937 family)